MENKFEIKKSLVGDKAVEELVDLEERRMCFAEFLVTSRMAASEKPKKLTDIARELGRINEVIKSWEKGISLPSEPKQAKEEDSDKYEDKVVEFWAPIANAYGVEVATIREKFGISLAARKQESKISKKGGIISGNTKLSPDKHIDYFNKEKIATHFSGGPGNGNR